MLQGSLKPQTGNEMLFNILRLYVNGWLWLTEHLRWITIKLKSDIALISTHMNIITF